MSLLKKLSNAAFVLNCLKIIGLLMGMVTHAPLLVPRTRCRARCCKPCRRTGLTEQVLEAPGSAAAFLRTMAYVMLMIQNNPIIQTAGDRWVRVGCTPAAAAAGAHSVDAVVAVTDPG
ncbi:unnamed protein product [Plutella xylostella]|uniref:(diamondback moth) hypothetical protein n=1 Tax=Plutella xylostella TaxID=51655 RepID=A0A8S4EE43_PLUXY|nr:unnamed protein product [Plutella xylostella]